MNDPGSLKILIIDDVLPILQTLDCLLSREGHCIDTATSGEQALKQLEDTPYDLVITDIRMPGLSGTELATRIKTMTGGTLPVIGMSGTPWLLNHDIFDACLSKPCTKKELCTAIRQVTRS
jgi:CheY-like chemotaxis protein